MARMPEAGAGHQAVHGVAADGVELAVRILAKRGKRIGIALHDRLRLPIRRTHLSKSSNRARAEIPEYVAIDELGHARTSIKVTADDRTAVRMRIVENRRRQARIVTGRCTGRTSGGADGVTLVPFHRWPADVLSAGVCELMLIDLLLRFLAHVG